MRKNKTTEQFKKEVYNKVKDEYIVLGEYIKSSIPLEIKHNTCGHIYHVKPNNFLTGRRCPKCFGTTKKTTEQFKKEIYELAGNEYEVLSEYVNNVTKIEIRHNKCSHTYLVKPNSFLRRVKCPKCMGVNHNIDRTKFKKEVYNLVKDEYEVLGEYINANTSIGIKHNTCGHVYLVRPVNFLKNGTRCPKCAKKGQGKKRKTTEQFKQEVYNLVKDEYEVLSEYINANTPIEIKHNNCKNIYKVRPVNFIKNGTRCPECSNAKKKL